MSAYSPPIRTISVDGAADLLSRAEALTTRFRGIGNPDLVRRAPEVAAELHPQLRAVCRPPDPGDGLVVLRGLRVADDTLGSTPPHWSKVDGMGSTRWSVTLLLLASVLGRAFGWAGQQDGRLVHDIVPAAGHEHEQTGMSSTVLLSPHSEDAFHPGRAHLLMLGCLRNHDQVATHAACVRRAALDPADVDVLTRPTVPILPDDSYGDETTFGRERPAIPTLWRSADGLCLRFDPAYTPLHEADESYRAAYQRLAAALQGATVAVSLRPGDILLIDNDTVVHGRAPFRARYDGTDRWLKRANIRLPQRARPSAEATEHGYGQHIVEPS